MTKMQLEDMRRQNTNLIEITHPGKDAIYLHHLDGGNYIGKTGNSVKTRMSKHYRGRKNLNDAIERTAKTHPENLGIILHEGLSKERANFWEKVEIARYNALYPNGYNHTTGGDFDYIVVNEKTCPIVQLDKDTGEFVKQWPSQAVAVRKTGVSQSHLCECLSGKRKSTDGYKWMTLVKWKALQNAENTTPM